MTHQELLPIPPLETAEDPIRSPADLRERWRALMGPLGFSQRLLWFGFIGPDRRFVRMLDHVEITRRPQAQLLRNLMSALQTLLDSDDFAGSSVALLLTGPGRGGIAATDRVWAQQLRAAAARFGVPLEPVFRANDDALLPVHGT